MTFFDSVPASVCHFDSIAQHSGLSVSSQINQWQSLTATLSSGTSLAMVRGNCVESLILCLGRWFKRSIKPKIVSWFRRLGREGLTYERRNLNGSQTAGLQ